MISRVVVAVIKSTRCSGMVTIRWRVLAVSRVTNLFFNLMNSNIREMLRGTEMACWKMRTTILMGITSNQKMEVKWNKRRVKRTKSKRQSKTIMISQIKVTIAAFSLVGKVIARQFYDQANITIIWSKNSRKIRMSKMMRVAKMDQVANHFPAQAWNLKNPKISL